jgi:anti-anti-sigma factor
MRLGIRITALDASHVVVCLAGELDLDTAPEFAAAIEGMGQSAVRYVVLDLSELEYLSSAGASTIVRAHDELESHGSELVITGAHGTVQTVLDLLGLTKLIRLAQRAPEGKSSVANAGAHHR